MTRDAQEFTEAITDLVSSVLVALEILGYVSRHLHPPDLGALIGALVGKDDAVRTGLERVRGIDWPEPLLPLARPVECAAENVCLAFDGLRGSSDDPNGVFQAYRAMRNRTRAIEALYPTTRSLLPVSRFFLEPDARDDPVLADRLAASDPGGGDVGIMHAGGERAARGGYSMYVPEYYRSDSADAVHHGAARWQRQWRGLSLDLGGRGALPWCNPDQSDRAR